MSLSFIMKWPRHDEPLCCFTSPYLFLKETEKLPEQFKIKAKQSHISDHLLMQIVKQICATSSGGSIAT